MTDWDDFGFDEQRYDREPDAYERSARELLEQFFDQNDSGVYFANQLAVRNEDQFFHWVTHRALSDLLAEGAIKSENRKLATGSEIKLLWHKRYRYYKRDATRVVELVDEYGSPNCAPRSGFMVNR